MGSVRFPFYVPRFFFFGAESFFLNFTFFSLSLSRSIPIGREARTGSGVVLRFFVDFLFIFTLFF